MKNPFDSAYLPCITDEAIENLLIQMAAHAPIFQVMVWLPYEERESIGLIQKIFLKLKIPMAGAVFPELITPEGFHSHGMVLNFLNSPEPLISISFEKDDTPEDHATCLEEAILSWKKSASDIRQIFLIFDSQIRQIGSLLTDLHVLLGRNFQFIGVNAGNESFTPMDCLFDEQKSFGYGVIALALPLAAKTAIEHGYPVDSGSMKATNTSPNCVNQIDGQPAMDVYRQWMLDQYSITLTPENFYQYAVHYPFGLVSMLDVCVRIPVGYTEDGSIHFIGEIPPFSALRLLRAPDMQQASCTTELAAQVGSGLGPFWVFYCAGRRMHFKNESALEIRNLAEQLRSSSVFGALSLGEFATQTESGFALYHNAAMVCIRP